MAEEREEGKGFKVEDRRRFSESGESRSGVEPGRSGPDPEASGAAAASASAAGPRAETEPAGEALPEINFSTFIISLSTQALMHLGEIPNPLSGQVERDIAVAKQMIDIIGMLREKSRGNLDQGEEKLMENILFDLRMRYVDVVKKKQP